MTKPIRIQRKRTKGWKMPPNTVSVSRPGRWGNPYVVGLVSCSCRTPGECHHNSFHCETAADAVTAYRAWITDCIAHGNGRTREAIKELRGKNLACFCPISSPCHADVLLELANA